LYEWEPHDIDKDHDTAEEGARSNVLVAKHTASLQLLSTAGGKQGEIGLRVPNLKFQSVAKGGVKLVVQTAVAINSFF